MGNQRMRFWDPISTTLGDGHLIALAPEGVHVCVAGTNLSMGWCLDHLLAFEEGKQCPKCHQESPGAPEIENRQDGPANHHSAQPGPAGAPRRANGSGSTTLESAQADPTQLALW